ncbi:hypothetical protein LXEBMM8_EKPBGFGD_00069 [Lactiplantibacillus xiangfangensis]
MMIEVYSIKVAPRFINRPYRSIGCIRTVFLTLKRGEQNGKQTMATLDES